MQLTTLIEQLKSALMDSAELVRNMEQQIIQIALSDFSRYRPAVKVATFSLMTNQFLYPAPAHIMRIRTVLYGKQQRSQPCWSAGYPRHLPKLSLVEGDDGNRLIQISRFPDDSVLMRCGREVSYTYYANRVIENEAISVPSEDEALLLLRCIAEAVKYIAVHQLNKTVSVRNSIGGEAKNGTPAAVHEQLMSQFERQVKDA
ncbi:hypothetical protein [Vibrio spartinae]|uniref:Uncharacterized protein n=1 Tax=Vibrio spartinae TaxID=1918945 RepID=A0A1N6M5M3_9VIBR|nr:hypothetical protein [Vibrio spartinae]SIO94657.1 hypothetical protein VSP9026_02386 [Vibrio spartinae]